MKRNVIIIGAAGRDFHNFNTFFRGNKDYNVVAFTANQIPDIDGRKYPTELAGKEYPAGIPIVAEEELPALIKKHKVDVCVFAYSDVPYNRVMGVSAIVNAAGADEIDVVISVGKYLSGRYQEVFDEIEEIKASARNAHLKVILESGSLPSMNDIKRASLLAIAAGADFIKTSTGKTEPAATLEAAYVMCHTIREYYQSTGVKIGFKPAGGIATTEEAVKFYTIVNHILGEEWMNKDFFRFGASRLANNLLSDIYGKQIKYY